MLFTRPLFYFIQITLFFHELYYSVHKSQKSVKKLNGFPRVFFNGFFLLLSLIRDLVKLQQQIFYLNYAEVLNESQLLKPFTGGFCTQLSARDDSFTNRFGKIDLSKFAQSNAFDWNFFSGLVLNFTHSLATKAVFQKIKNSHNILASVGTLRYGVDYSFFLPPKTPAFLFFRFFSQFLRFCHGSRGFHFSLLASHFKMFSKNVGTSILKSHKKNTNLQY